MDRSQAHKRLLFVSEMSSRYHRRRASFLDRTNLTLTFFSLAAGTSAFVSLFGGATRFAQVATFLIAICSIIQIVYRPEACAGQHKNWLGRWLDIQVSLRAPDLSETADFTSLFRESAAIERECIGELRALQADCYNRATRALGLDTSNDYKLRWHHRLLIQVVSFESAFEK